MSTVYPSCISPVLPHPKEALLDCNLVAVEDHLSTVQCNVQETRCEFCDMECYPVDHCAQEGMDNVSKITRVGCGVSLVKCKKKCTKKISPYTVTPPAA